MINIKQLTVLRVLVMVFAGVAAANAADNKPTMTVTATTAVLSAMPRQTAYSGPVVGVETLLVHAGSSQGRIQQVLVEEGQRVRAGEVLAVLDTSLLQVQKSQQQANRQHAVAALAQQEANLEEAQAQLAQARLDKKRVATEPGAEPTADQRATAERIADIHVKAAKQAINMAQADLALADAQLAELDLRMNEASVRAPAAGKIMARQAHAGLVLGNSNEPLFVLLKESALEVEIEVTGSEAGKLVPGTPATIQLVGGSRSYPGKIRRGALQVDRQTQTARVRVAFDKAPDALPGQFAKVSVASNPKKAVYLPDSAIRFEGNATYFFSVVDGKAKKLPVRLGERSNGLVEVISGVAPGTRVVTGAVAFLHDGEAVRIAPEQSTPKKSTPAQP